MTIALLLVFILGYFAIAFENPLKLDKAASALLTGVLCWGIYFLNAADKNEINEDLLHHFANISSILFFLLGAMVVVELIDSHDGFSVITERISTRSKAKLLWIISLLTFFLSAFLDNLTTAIVMTSMTGRILSEREDRLWFAGIIIIAANAGGAFSPLGDVTTTMLWIGGQITPLNIILKLLIPGLCVLLVPLLIVTPKFKNQMFESGTGKEKNYNTDARIVFFSGIILLLMVPVFKVVTHLPPFMGMLFSLGILWLIVSFLHLRKSPEEKSKLSVSSALQRIDTPSILFFLGILLAVAALQTSGMLKSLAGFLETSIGNFYFVGAALGILSAIVDNVPLVAAVQGMYDLNTFHTDHPFWEFIALTTGTGGSVIIIGSAAGVAAMGIEKIDFMWYLKKISWIALAGFVAGVLAFWIQTEL